MTGLRFPWDGAPAPAEAPRTSPPDTKPPPKPRGRRPGAGYARLAAAAPSPWLHRHLTIDGPAAPMAEFLEAARGPGVVPWQLNYAVVEEDVFNLAASQPPHRRTLTVEGCRILARQFRQRVEAHQARAAALAGGSRACPFDLHALVPVPAAVLQLGPTHPHAVAWMRENWGMMDTLRQVALRPKPSAGRRLQAGYLVAGYGFFTDGDTPATAVRRLQARWAELRFVLTPRPAD